MPGSRKKRTCGSPQSWTHAPSSAWTACPGCCPPYFRLLTGSSCWKCGSARSRPQRSRRLWGLWRYPRDLRKQSLSGSRWGLFEKRGILQIVCDRNVGLQVVCLRVGMYPHPSTLTHFNSSSSPPCPPSLFSSPRVYTSTVSNSNNT